MVYYIKFTPERWRKIEGLFKPYIRDIDCWGMFNLIYFSKDIKGDTYISNCDIECLEGVTKTEYNNIDDFINKAMESIKTVFTKADLKSGMVVELKNGGMYLVVNNSLISTSGQMYLDNYNDNLEYIENNCHVDRPDFSEGWSINKVFMKDPHTWGLGFNGGLTTSLSCIWKRKSLKKVEITMDEIAKKFGISVTQLRIKE